MALTADFANRIIHSSASITDVVAFHAALRDIEDGEDAVIHPTIHTYKEIDLGGAVFPAIAFVNGWTLQFPAGNYELRGGNVLATINPVSGCYVKYTASSAYAVTSVGAGGATPSDIADAVWAHTTGAAVATRMAEAWGRLGLDPSKPLISGQAQISFGAIVMALTGNETTSTLTRQ